MVMDIDNQFRYITLQVYNMHEISIARTSTKSSAGASVYDVFPRKASQYSRNDPHDYPYHTRIQVYMRKHAD